MPTLTPSTHKRLLLLGLLQQGPMTGYELHRTVAAHGDLYSDLKKPNLYHLLERMASEGLVQRRVEGGARGPRRERLIYSLTPAGRRDLVAMLHLAIKEFNLPLTGLEVAVVLLDQLGLDEAAGLLRSRSATVRARREKIAEELGEAARPGSAGDHLLALIDAELAWIERALKRIEGRR